MPSKKSSPTKLGTSNPYRPSSRPARGRCEMSLDSLPSSLRSTSGTVPPAKRPRALSSFLRSRSLGRQRQRAGRGGRGARKNGEQPHAKQIAPLREDVMGRYYRGERRREKSCQLFRKSEPARTVVPLSTVTCRHVL